MCFYYFVELMESSSINEEVEFMPSASNHGAESTYQVEEEDIVEEGRKRTCNLLYGIIMI